MIKFFRRIRQQLLTENKFPKYLLYAIGEIVLVVIGILIAVQVNNWNIDKNNRKIEGEYLTNLVNDLNDQLNLINDQKLHENDRLTKCEKALKLIQEYPVNIEELGNQVLIIGRKTFIVPKASFEEIKNSGNLSLINNELRNEIMKYYQYSEYIEKAISNININWVDNFELFLLNNVYNDLGRNQEKLRLSDFSNYDMTINAVPFKDSQAIIKTELDDPYKRIKLHNNLISRARVSKLNISFLKDYEGKTEILLNKIKSDFNNSKK